MRYDRLLGWTILSDHLDNRIERWRFELDVRQRGFYPLRHQKADVLQMKETPNSHIIRLENAARVEYRLQTLIQCLRILCRVNGLDRASDLRFVGS